MLNWRLEKGSAPLWLRALIPAISIAATFLLTAALLAVVRANPFQVFYFMLVEPLTAPVSALEVLVKATPLLLTGVAVVVAFSAGYYNIGAEGQLYAGALAAAWIGQLPLAAARALPAPLVIALMMTGGFLAGMLWALVPALLRTRLGVDEVVTTLLLNSVMLFLVNAILTNFWLDPVTHWPQSPRISADYAVIVPGSRVHFGLIVGLAVMLAAWWTLNRTPFGLRLRATGLGREAARFMGVNVSRTLLIAALVSGGIAGLAGMGEVAGIHHRLLEDISPGYGYSGIVIATLGAVNPFGAGGAALFIALILTGGQSVSRQMGIPTFLSDVVQATLLLVTLGLLLLTRYRVRRVKVGAIHESPRP